eukprot:TRINITY_DN8496_c0_g1_i1.p1 TRINITY_DN8496_c0_g1~~TRINITY_DN8496_c0_g1_i1.p1  ORF type:complete len:404 (-),score=91.30 TRINITY_DN8496_c0_g1_i1:478-1689(-)
MEILFSCCLPDSQAPPGVDYQVEEKWDVSYLDPNSIQVVSSFCIVWKSEKPTSGLVEIIDKQKQQSLHTTSQFFVLVEDQRVARDDGSSGGADSNTKKLESKLQSEPRVDNGEGVDTQKGEENVTSSCAKPGMTVLSTTSSTTGVSTLATDVSTWTSSPNMGKKYPGKVLKLQVPEAEPNLLEETKTISKEGSTVDPVLTIVRPMTDTTIPKDVVSEGDERRSVEGVEGGGEEGDEQLGSRGKKKNVGTRRIFQPESKLLSELPSTSWPGYAQLSGFRKTVSRIYNPRVVLISFVLMFILSIHLSLRISKLEEHLRVIYAEERLDPEALEKLAFLHYFVGILSKNLSSISALSLDQNNLWKSFDFLKKELVQWLGKTNNVLNVIKSEREVTWLKRSSKTHQIT